MCQVFVHKMVIELTLFVKLKWDLSDRLCLEITYYGTHWGGAPLWLRLRSRIEVCSGFSLLGWSQPLLISQ